MMEKEINIVVEQHVEELKKEIEQEFLNVLKNNIINPYETEILLGENFAFLYTGTTRLKRSIRLNFEVYRRTEIEIKLRNKKFHELLGKIYVTVRMRP